VSTELFTDETEGPTDQPKGYRPPQDDVREPRQRSVRQPGRPRASEPRKRKPAAKPEKIDYKTSIQGMLQIPAAGLLFAAQRTKNSVLLCDAVAVGKHAEPIAQACDDLAQKDEWFASALRFIVQVGPYGAFITTVAPLFAQLATNHGAPLAITQAFGAVPPRELLTDAGISVAETSPNGQEQEADEHASAAV